MKRKTGGRQKGTPNKKTVVLEELIQNKFPDFNPILSMIEIAVSDFTPTDLQFQCLKEISGYIYPKRKPIELNDRDEEIKNNKIEVVFVDSKKDIEELGKQEKLTLAQ